MINTFNCNLPPPAITATQSPDYLLGTAMWQPTALIMVIGLTINWMVQMQMKYFHKVTNKFN